MEFVHGADSVILSCEAYGEPRPTVRDYEFIFECVLKYYGQLYVIHRIEILTKEKYL